MPVMLLLPFFALVFASNFILSLRFLFHWLHLYTPCDALRLLRLTGDSQYLSRGEMMSTRSRRSRKSTQSDISRVSFPRPFRTLDPLRHIAPTASSLFINWTFLSGTYSHFPWTFLSDIHTETHTRDALYLYLEISCLHCAFKARFVYFSF